MSLIKRIVIGDSERGLLYRNRRLQRILQPGVSWVFGRSEVRVHDTARPQYTGTDLEALVSALGSRLERDFVLADIGVNEVGLVSFNGRLQQVLEPGSRALYWKGVVKVQVECVPIRDAQPIPVQVMRRLRQIGALQRVATVAEVPEQSTGLLLVDGSLTEQLSPGVYAYWNFQRNVSIEVVDLRVQAVEVSGQELLTRDKVSLRVNLSASVRVTDPVAVRTRVKRYDDFLYRELQYGLRKAVATKTLDQLLGDKASLDGDIFGYVRERVSEVGIEVRGVGIKDVILPGEMKSILNEVVQAEKTAQANTIRRREESNATRSALNTARLIADNPTLMRLKELETLEKVTEKIDKLTVFGGLDGVLNQLVSIREN